MASRLAHSGLTVSLLAGVWLGACEERAHPKPGPAVRNCAIPSCEPVGRDSAFAVRARSEIAALLPDVTLNEWLRDHLRDTAQLFSSILHDPTHDDWCARATLEDTLPGGARLLRRAYFYLPGARPDSSLPPGGEAKLAPQPCVLGAVWIETPLPHAEPSQLTANRLVANFSTQYGAAASPDDDLHFSGSAYWRPFLAWRKGALVVLGAWDRPPSVQPVERLLAIALLPNATLGRGPRQLGGDRDDWRFDLAERATHLSGAPPAEITRMLALIQLVSSEERVDSAGAGSVRLQLVSTLRDWLRGTPQRPAADRAAALLAADLVLQVPWAAAGDSVSRGQLESLGARFVYDRLGGYMYTHALEQAALAADGEGQVSKLALLSRLYRGFDDTGMCSAGEEEFRRVIAEGEPLLARLDDGRDRARLHFLLGDAYADIVGLADGISDYAEPEKYRGEAETARARSIEHYRQGFSLDRGSSQARAAWQQAWRLTAGLPPLDLRFFCVYD